MAAMWTSWGGGFGVFGCSGLALCGVKVKQLFLVGQIIITSREPGFSINLSVNPNVPFPNGKNTRNHNHNHNQNHHPHYHL
jgi:hypothetical protein